MKVAVLMGSASDKEHMAKAMEMFDKLGVEAEQHVMSAHRTPGRVAEFSRAARDNGFGVIVAAAGMAAALPGTVAAHTTLPVIGVPLARSALNGVDSLYAIVQMPPGIPVGCVGIDGAANAAILAAEIIAVTDPAVAEKLDELRAEWQ